MENWLGGNWFNLVSTAGIIASLLFTAVSLRNETKTRKIGSLLFLTEGHRDLWSEIFEHPELSRVLETGAATNSAISTEESIFVGLAIQHLASAFEALKAGIVIQQEGLCDDVKAFFSLPIPRTVWEKTKHFQNQDFVKFVENCRTGQPS